MGTTTTSLFAGKHLERELEDGLARAMANVSQMDADGVAAENLNELVERFQYRPLRLLREQAQFEVADGGTTNNVSLVVPYEGNARLFGLAPKGLTGRRDVKAKIVDNDGRWLDDVEHTITFAQDFPSATPHERVRHWAKEQVDYVETILGFIQKVVDRHNSTLPSQVSSWMADRRKTLESAASLKDQLGQGI